MRSDAADKVSIAKLPLSMVTDLVVYCHFAFDTFERRNQDDTVHIDFQKVSRVCSLDYLRWALEIHRYRG